MTRAALAACVLLAGCATTSDLDVAGASVACAVRGGLLGMVRIDGDQIVGIACLMPAAKPDHNS